MTRALPISLSTASLYPLPLSKVLELAAKAGFDGIELVVTPGVYHRSTRMVRRWAHDQGLEIYSVHQPLLGLGPWRNPDRRIRDTIQVSLELGCPLVVIHGPPARDWASPIAQQWLTTLQSCQKLINKTSLKLSVENPNLLPDSDGQFVFSRLRDLAAFVLEHDLWLTLDTTHAGSGGIDLLQAYRQTRARLVNVHLSDLNEKGLKGGNVLQRALYHHQPPGKGVLPLAELIATMVQDGYAGPISLEISPLALLPRTPAQRDRLLASVVDYVLDAMEKDKKRPPC